jgi:hypothetical protein
MNAIALFTQGCSGAMVAYLPHNLKIEGRAQPVFKYFSVTPPENSGGAENSTEYSGPHAQNFFCSMYEISQQHPVWVAENHVKPCNSVFIENNVRKKMSDTIL